MSLDVLMIRTKTNQETVLDDITNENIVPFTQTEIAAEIRKISAELGVSCDGNDLSWNFLSNDGWTIEFVIGENPETDYVMLHIWGDEPEEVLSCLTADLNTRLVDGDTGEFIAPRVFDP